MKKVFCLMIICLVSFSGCSFFDKQKTEHLVVNKSNINEVDAGKNYFVSCDDFVCFKQKFLACENSQINYVLDGVEYIPSVGMSGDYCLLNLANTKKKTVTSCNFDKEDLIDDLFNKLFYNINSRDDATKNFINDLLKQSCDIKKFNVNVK